jgi:hypothetical protein
MHPVTFGDKEFIVEKPTVEREGSPLSHLPSSDVVQKEQVSPKPTSFRQDVLGFLKGPLQTAGGLTLLGVGLVSATAMLPITALGMGLGVGIGAAASLIGKDIKTKNAIDMGATVGGTIATAGGIGFGMLGIHLLKTSDSEFGKRVGNNVPKNMTGRIVKKVEAHKNSNTSVNLPTIDLKVKDPLIGNKLASSWLNLAEEDPEIFAHTLHRYCDIDKDLPKASLDELLEHLSKNLSAAEFGKLVTQGLQIEISKHSDPTNLLRLTTTSGNQLFIKFKDAYLKPELEKSKQLNELVTSIGKADPLVIGTKGSQVMNGAEAVKNAELQVANYITAVKGILGSDSNAINAFNQILKSVDKAVKDNKGLTFKDANAGEKAVASLVFLRVLNPYLVANPDFADYRERLMTLTKITQNMANGVNFGDKEKYMVGFNPVIAAKRNDMDDFLKKL